MVWLSRGNHLDCQGKIKVCIKNTLHLISRKQVKKLSFFMHTDYTFLLCVFHRNSTQMLATGNLSMLFQEQCLPSAWAKWNWPSPCFFPAPETWLLDFNYMVIWLNQRDWKVKANVPRGEASPQASKTAGIGEASSLLACQRRRGNELLWAWCSSFIRWNSDWEGSLSSQAQKTSVKPPSHRLKVKMPPATWYPLSLLFDFFCSLSNSENTENVDIFSWKLKN